MPQFSRLRRARDAQVLQRVVLQETQHLVPAILRLDEARILLDVINQPGLMLLQLEIIIVLHQLRHLAVFGGKRAVRQPVLFRQESLLPGRIKSLVSRLVKMALPRASCERIACTTCLCRASVVRTKSSFVNSSFAANAFHIRGQFIAISLRCPCPAPAPPAGLSGRARPGPSGKTPPAPGFAATRAITSAMTFS